MMEHENRHENGGSGGSGLRRDNDGIGGWECPTKEMREQTDRVDRANILGGNVPLTGCAWTRWHCSHVRGDDSGCECESGGAGWVYGHATTSTCSCCGGSVLWQARRGNSVRGARGTRWMGRRRG